MNAGNVFFNTRSTDVSQELKKDASGCQEKIRIEDCKKVSAKTSLDSFENGGNITDILYELYPNYQVAKEMPKSLFGDQFGYDMQKEISGCMNDFYAGKISQSEVEAFFEECCISMMTYRKQKCQTSGDNSLDKKQVISEMYEVFAKENMRAANKANYEEGEAINETYGGRNDDWVYYNSDYHSQCAEMKERLQKAVETMTNKWEIPSIDTDEVERNSGLTLDGGFDFNSGWNFTYRNQVGRASIEDESLTPPGNFKFFYKENFDALPPDKSNLWISINGEQINRKDPFVTSRTGSLKGQIFYLNDLLEDSSEWNTNDEFKRFINSFTVFTRWYSFQSKINDQFGNFVSPEY